jgi:Spy/CpxP family protein refolding chaperone
MKSKFTFLLVPALVAALQFAPAVFAQPPDRPNRPSQMDRRPRWANLTDEERAKLKAAHQKAMEDPAVRAAQEKLRQARREFREVMRPALLKADPSIQPILEKLRPERPGRD